MPKEDVFRVWGWFWGWFFDPGMVLGIVFQDGLGADNQTPPTVLPNRIRLAADTWSAASRIVVGSGAVDT